MKKVHPMIVAVCAGALIALLAFVSGGGSADETPREPIVTKAPAVDEV